MTRFLRGIGLQQHTEALTNAGLKQPTDFSHVTPDDLKKVGLGYWDAVRLIVSFRCVGRKECPPIPIRDESLSVGRVMEWDAHSLGAYLESKNLRETAARVVAEGITGFVFVSMDAKAGVANLGVKLGEASAIRNLLSTGE